MANFQTRNLQLDLCVIMILLTYTDYSKSNQEQRIRLHIEKTVFVGETVTLHCNKTPFDDDFTWKINSSIIFSYDSTNNRSMINFSSNRIHINPAVSKDLKIHQIQASDAGNYTCHPAAIGWTLTITENQPSSPKQKPLDIIIIIISCSGVLMVFQIFTISFCIHRRWKKRKDLSHRETGQDFSQAPARGRIQTQTSQYFERYNSVYGQL
ncbi:uncharacterized protein LOC120487048 isoform X2 [Pimephales promelas]|uniref:uncharacterized protein LOC120487048 isoform X2 n=1 Tax=Pimephales promelas TaxID=90988 RepID=UPI0019556C47|nr:uncharacterized protein LOC120487048 isoform X2 [Pimephales promelas]XP_039539154.1 uncharacterized protein LOC120487048 isoform X2 [Pimephales promelas]